MESKWSLETLKESLENQISSVRDQIKEGDRRYSERFNSQEKAVEAALDSAKEAVTKAEVATEKRFDSVNEFRAVLSDQSKNFITRSEFDNVFNNLTEKILGLTTRIDKGEGKGQGLNAGWLYLVGAVSLISIIIGIFITLT